MALVGQYFFIFAVFFLSGCAITLHQNERICPKTKHSIRIATYNVYWQNASKNKHNPNSISHLIDEMNPDIIVLQETYCLQKRHLENQFQSKYPYRMFRHEHSPNHEDGLGILSRYPIVKNIFFPRLYGWFPGWIYIIKTPQGYVQVLNVHLNPMLVCGNNIGIFAEGLWATPKFRLMEMQYYYRFLNPKLSTIVAGDFNEGDGGVAVQYLRNHCFNDNLMRVPDRKTWHYQFGFLTFSGRYDRIFTTPDLCVHRCQVLQKGYSDHFPVMIDFSK